jgi:hypothetical protein
MTNWSSVESGKMRESKRLWRINALWFRYKVLTSNDMKFITGYDTFVIS